jgi:hypothetical protein
MTERNRVVQVRRFGGPDGLEVVDAPLPTAGHGEVRVRVEPAGNTCPFAVEARVFESAAGTGDVTHHDLADSGLARA